MLKNTLRILILVTIVTAGAVSTSKIAHHANDWPETCPPLCSTK